VFDLDVYCDGAFLVTAERIINEWPLTVMAPVGASCTAKEPNVPADWVFDRVNTVVVAPDGSSQVTLWNTYIGDSPKAAPAEPKPALKKDDEQAVLADAPKVKKGDTADD
jgi:hypothetical protein